MVKLSVMELTRNGIGKEGIRELRGSRAAEDVMAGREGLMGAGKGEAEERAGLGKPGRK